MNNNKKKLAFCWSGGKDSSLALYRLLNSPEFEVVYLFTTVNEHYKRVTMHGVREELLDKQTVHIGIPLKKVYLSETPDNNEYEQKMESMLTQLKAEGIEHYGFGDIYLEDLRTYRDNNLQKLGLRGVYPLWKEDTSALIGEFIQLGFKTITCCINDGYLKENHVGRIIDDTFIQELPANVDVCGENGEFHTFCFDGPIYKEPVSYTIGKKVYKALTIKTDCNVADNGSVITQGFWYIDLM